jgi:hypothetical protein
LLPAAGRFAFVELRTEELATTAMTLDKTELLGRPMNIGRPKGYVPGTSAPGEPWGMEGQQSHVAAQKLPALACYGDTCQSTWLLDRSKPWAEWNLEQATAASSAGLLSIGVGLQWPQAVLWFDEYVMCVLFCCAAANDTLAAAQQVAAALLGGVTPVVLLENMLGAATIRQADERQEVSGGRLGVSCCVHERQFRPIPCVTPAAGFLLPA